MQITRRKFLSFLALPLSASLVGKVARIEESKPK